MATDKQHTTLNVPTLRFPEFSGEWKETTLEDISVINPTNNKISDEFIYIDLESVEKGVLQKQQTFSKKTAPSRAQRVLQKNDILFQCVRPYQKNNYFFEIEDSKQWVASTGYAQIRTNQNPKFIYQLLSTQSFNTNVMMRCTGSSYPAINADDLSKIVFAIPNIQEQSKIANLMSILDERILTQKKVIERLETLINGLRAKLLTVKDYTEIKLGDVCSITTGRLDANAMEENGIYPFFTCAEYVSRINSYEFDDEALLISGNGANVGYIHYYNGKFNAYQRTYVLKNFTCDIQYVKFYLSTFLKRRIELEKNTGNTPYIILGTLSDMIVKLPQTDYQKKVVNVMLSCEEKFENAKIALKLLNDERKYLLSAMFI
jgi:type I restriction enzyme S subunit